jgi:potassium-transporting ATPase KdpC subunit
MSLKKELRRIPSPSIRLAVISMILCGLLFPLIVTGFSQILFPEQANGSMAHVGKTPIGSYQIAQNFSKPEFFHPRNSSLSSSAVDPDILLQDAQGQVGRISNATGISPSDINGITNQSIEGTFWIFGYPYVDVLKLNLVLVQEHQTIYKQLDPNLFQ